MEILAWTFLGGIVGAVLMDVTETYAAKVGITSGVNIALVGRWFLGMLRGQTVVPCCSQNHHLRKEEKTRILDPLETSFRVLPSGAIRPILGSGIGVIRDSR